MLYDSSGARKLADYHVVRPDGFTIPSEAAAIHGISTEQAQRGGDPLREVLARLKVDVDSFAPQNLIGHNIAFDRPILLNEFGRTDLAENISPLPIFCTMRSTTELCRIPHPSGGRGHKWPTLEELHLHLFGTGVAGAHNAESDVTACAECFFELKRRGVFRD